MQPLCFRSRAVPASRFVLGALTLFAFGLPSQAFAKTLVVAPLGGSDAKAVANVSSMMGSELSFLPGVDDVVELKAAQVNSGCLASASCLSGLLKSGPGDQLIAGTLAQNGPKYTLDLVLFDGPTNKMVRRKKFDLPATPEGVADGMNAVVKEILTGTPGGAPPGAAPATTAAKPAPSKPKDDDFAFEEDAPKPVARGGNPPKPAAKAAPIPAAKPAAKEISEDNFDIDLSDVDLEDEADDHSAAAKAQADADAKAKADADAKAKADADARAKATADAKRKAEEDARKKAEADAARKRADEEERVAAAAREAARVKAEDDARREAARVKAADDARRAEETRVAASRKAAEDAAARKAADDAARRKTAVAAAPTDDFDPNAISFGKSKVEDEEVNKAINFGPSKSSVSSFDDDEEPASKPAPKVVNLDDEDEDELMPRKKPAPPAEDEDDAPRARKVRPSAFDDDEPAPKPKPKPKVADDDEELTPTRPKPKARDDDDDDVAPRRVAKNKGKTEHKVSRVQIAIRGGYSRFYELNFITAGGELAIGLMPTLYLVGGIDTYSVQRQIPRFMQQNGQTQEWNTIFPGSFGLQYKAEGRIRPYVGADGMVVPYYFDANGKGSMAFGARARFGCDFMVVDNFGLNVNGSVGFWSGENWKLIQQGMGNLGVVPQVSAGTVLAF